MSRTDPGGEERPTPRQKASAEREWGDHDIDEDNPFLGVVEDLRDQGLTFREIYDLYEAVERDLGKASMAEEAKLIPEWEITVKVPDPDTPSGYHYEYYERMDEDAAEAERRVEEYTGHEVVSEKTKQSGYSRVL